MIKQKLTHIFAATLAVMTFTLLGNAQEHPSTVPAKEMKKLESLAGNWTIQSRYTPDEGKTWQSVPPSAVKLGFRQKNLMLAETPLETEKPGFHMENFITYDQYRKLYRMAAIDDMWGLMDVYEGTIDGDNLVLTNLKSGTFFPNESSGWRAFRITFELKSGERLMIVEKSDDGGKNWHPNFEITYTPA